MNGSKPSLRQRVLSVLLMATVYFLFMLAWKFFWPSPYEKQESVYSIILEVAFISLFWGVGMTLFPKKIPNCKLLVDDQSISNVLQYSGWMKWYSVRKTVTAGKVRTIREIKGKLGASSGLIASEQTDWKAWMWGGIFIPKTLPEYENLKALVESWQEPEILPRDV